MKQIEEENKEQEKEVTHEEERDEHPQLVDMDMEEVTQEILFVLAISDRNFLCSLLEL